VYKARAVRHPQGREGRAEPYTYNPDYQFKGVKTKERFTIKPGPNKPVGAVWIELSIESYGIHGTPEPAKIAKSYSHGCVRLTNWDAKELASMVQKGTIVEFTELSTSKRGNSCPAGSLGMVRSGDGHPRSIGAST
jgi:lipoprotein-anchoring transpeptidase ErfK/SrfK